MGRSRVRLFLLLAVLAPGFLLGAWQAGEPRPSAVWPLSESIPEPPTVPAEQDARGGSQAPPSGRWALLVGVTRYDHLPPVHHLEGPGNDVRAMRDLLRSQFDFPADHILCLAEGEGADHRPTRANIAAAFRGLIKDVRPGSQVVLFLAGHGDRQPESDPPHPLYPQPDGVSEIFLPADVKKWQGFPRRVPNAIVDDDFRDWLTALARKKASVWAIFDCCHSGHITRGTETVREPGPGALVPPAELDRARARARRRNTMRSTPDRPAPFLPPALSDCVVALYACRPQETTPEAFFPSGQIGAKCHGLLTYTLLEVLTRSAASPAPLTYRELARRIQSTYAGRPQGAPTPMVEGKGQDRVVLGVDRPGRPKWTLSLHKDGYRVNAGDLHGLTPNSVLAVFSPPGSSTRSELVGHARVVATGPFAATVEPCVHAGKPMPGDLPNNAPCEVVYTDFSLSRFKVAVQSGAGREVARERALAALKRLEDPETRMVEVVANPRAADWILRLESGPPELIEASGNRRPYRLPAVENPEFVRGLRKNLERVFRARSLLAAARRLEEDGAGGTSAVDVGVEVIRQRGEEKEEVVSRVAGGWVFHPGDRVSFRVRNKSAFLWVDVNLFIVNPDFKIHPFYPGKGEVGKPLPPGQAVRTPAGDITEEPPFGQEFLVVIAVPAANPPVDFSLLTQGGVRERGYEATAPLAQLLERGMYRVGDRGGLERLEQARHAMRILSWRTAPGSAR